MRFPSKVLATVVVLSAAVGCGNGSREADTSGESSSSEGRATPAAPVLPTAFLGLELAQPLVMEECTATDSGLTYEGYWDQPTLPCWESTLGPDGFRGEKPAPPADYDYKVQFGPESVPQGVGNEASVRVLNGVLQEIELKTQSTLQASIMQLLVAKFGIPEGYREQDLQNGFGAQFKSINATWRDQKTIVRYYGRLTGSEGHITVETLENALSREEQRRERSADSF